MNSLQTAFWKLATLVGVISAGCFVVLQVQDSLGTLASEASAAPTQIVAADGAVLDDAAAGDAAPAASFAPGAYVSADGPGQATDPFEQGVEQPSDVTPSDFGGEPFFANVADTDSDTSVAAAPQHELASADDRLLAQADPVTNPFEMVISPAAKKTQPTLAPTQQPRDRAVPRPFDLPPGEEAKPIGRAQLDTLGTNPASAAQSGTQTQVVPAGGLQPIPTDTRGTGLPMVRPAGARDDDLSLEPIPDPFELNIPPIEPITPRSNQPTTTNAAQAPTGPATNNDPFALDLAPITDREPVRSASAVQPPTGGTLQPLDTPLEELPVLDNFSPTPAPAPNNTLNMGSQTPFPPSSGSSLDPSPLNNPVVDRSSRASVDVGAPISPSPIDFLGNATIDRDVPRGLVQPHLQMTKVAPNRAVLGKPLVYEIRLSNVGNATAYQVEVEDRIPKGTRLEGTSPQAEMPDQTKKLVWRFDAVAPGDTKSLKVRVVPIEPGKIGSIATVKFSAETAAETHIAAPSLQFRLIGQPEAALRDKVVYRFEMANTGDEDARDVVIRCLVPEGLQSPNQVSDLEYPVGLLPAGAQKTVDLPLTAIGEGHYSTKATIEAVGVSPVDSQSDIHIIKSRIALDRTGPGKRYVGSQVEFTNRVTNNSSKTLTGIQVTETLPENARFVTASDSGSLVDSKTVRWTIGSLAPGATRDVRITFVPENSGKKVSMVNAIGADGSQTAIKASMTVVGYAALDLNTSHENRPYDIGEQVSLKMTIKNGGTASASAVETSVRVPPELRFVSATGPVQYTQIGDSINFSPIPQINHGSDVTFDLLFETIQQGDGTLNMQLKSNDLEKGLIDQVAIRVIDLQ